MAHVSNITPAQQWISISYLAMYSKSAHMLNLACSSKYSLIEPLAWLANIEISNAFLKQMSDIKKKTNK